MNLSDFKFLKGRGSFYLNIVSCSGLVFSEELRSSV